MDDENDNHTTTHTSSFVRDYPKNLVRLGQMFNQKEVVSKVTGTTSWVPIVIVCYI